MNHSFNGTPGYRVVWGIAQNYVEIHFTFQLPDLKQQNGTQLNFASSLSENTIDDEDYDMFAEILNVPGVQSIGVNKYALGIGRSMAVSWESIIKDVIEIFNNRYKPKGKLRCIENPDIVRISNPSVSNNLQESNDDLDENKENAETR
jgi:hypothetical protein